MRRRARDRAVERDGLQTNLAIIAQNLNPGAGSVEQSSCIRAIKFDTELDLFGVSELLLVSRDIEH